MTMREREEANAANVSATGESRPHHLCGILPRQSGPFRDINSPCSPIRDKFGGLVSTTRDAQGKAFF